MSGPLPNRLLATELYENEENRTKWNKMEHFPKTNSPKDS